MLKEPLRLAGRDAFTHPGVDLCAFDPVQQCGTQPILGAIDSTAAHSEGDSPRCSCTKRTARSRTSGENLLDLFMASSS